jgi:H/ACA ribonucleoprotein complex subunit 1
MGTFVHDCEEQMVCVSTNTKIPYFNAPIYLENMASYSSGLCKATRDLTCMQTPIGKVDEILGAINSVHFTIQPQEGIKAKSFKSGDKFYIGGDKLLPLEK